ncbi:hypothetical protein [Nannocystis pusilla]|uniref:hypothetical protein n=1 Tax=Nannocystis pusilla TaxID=889268 RepID=UPI003B7CD524
MISGLARAAAAAEQWGEPDLRTRCLALATAAARRLLDAHVGAHGEVMRVDFDGDVHTRGYLEDVAFLARACLDLHEATLDLAWQDAAASWPATLWRTTRWPGASASTSPPTTPSV